MEDPAITVGLKVLVASISAFPDTCTINAPATGSAGPVLAHAAHEAGGAQLDRKHSQYIIASGKRQGGGVWVWTGWENRPAIVEIVR
jgi:hypothetical protein